MSDIYIYSKGNDDYSTIGEHGALNATMRPFDVDERKDGIHGSSGTGDG